MESINSDLLNDLEAYLIARIDVNIDGMPNRAMILLHLLQNERKPKTESTVCLGEQEWEHR